jgi:hypothetical protein
MLKMYLILKEYLAIPAASAEAEYSLSLINSEL